MDGETLDLKIKGNQVAQIASVNPGLLVRIALQNLGWTFVKKYLIYSSILLWLSGCGTPPVSPEASVPDSTPAVEEVAPSPSPSPDVETTVPDELLISSEGVGLANLGMTLGELKQVLGAEAEFVVESPFMVDFDAIAVRQAGEVQFYILYLASETFTDEDVIQGLMTDNPKFLTREAVGAGVAIAQAESVYGKATLSYNTQMKGENTSGLRIILLLTFPLGRATLISRPQAFTLQRRLTLMKRKNFSQRLRLPPCWWFVWLKAA
ncbi:MAG: hypothetical protein HC832_03615 [Leptolyngbyaceae cyanobacterium RM1_405_57]|nr:hypothetical protein [Leptolyngbyaceae cyanobacterium RM1_405_57]